MQLDDSCYFCEPSLRQFAGIWIGILAQNGRVSQCLVYSSILIFDLLPISGSSDWAAKENVDGMRVIKSHTNRWVLDQTRQPVKTMLKYIVDELCVNAVGVFVVRNAASEAYPCLLKGTRFEDDGVLNNNVSHTCKVRQAGCHPIEQAAWINESAEALSLVVDEANPIRSEVVFGRDEIVYVHPNKERAEEYSHLLLEQCKRVYDDLVNQYKS